MIDVKKLISSYMESVKGLFKKSKKQTTETSTQQPAQPQTEETNPKRDKMNQYVIDWVTTFLSTNSKLKNINLTQSSSSGEQYFGSRAIDVVKQYAHYLPIWKEMGLIEYSGESLEESVKIISSELYADTFKNQTHTLYNEKTLAEYIAKKPEIEALLANIENEFMRDKLGTCVSLIDKMETMISKPHSTVSIQSRGEEHIFADTKDSDVIQVYINKINTIKREINDLLLYYSRAVEKNDTATIEMMKSRYGISNFDFHDIFKLDPAERALGYSELENKYDKHKILTKIVSLLNNDNLLITNIFQPNNSEKLNQAIADITDNISEGQKSLGDDYFVSYVDIINKHFVQNDNFNNIFFKKTPPTMQEAEKLAQDTFAAVKEVIESSYLKVGIDLKLNFEEENLVPGQQTALGSFTKTDDNKGVITIYRKQLKKVIDELEASPIISAQIISTIFHESGHAIDDFWHTISKTKNTPSFISELKTTLNTTALGPEDIFFISCVSPSFKNSVAQMLQEGSTIENIAAMINDVEYYELKEEHVARNTSKHACRFLLEQIAPYYKDDEVKAETIAIIASSIDVISGTHYSYADFEKTDKVETLVESIKQDMSSVGTLIDIEHLATDFDLSNLSNKQVQSLSEKAACMFKKYYTELPKDKKQELVYTSIIEGRYPILEMVAINDLFREGTVSFNPEAVIEYYRAVACRAKTSGEQTRKFLMSTALTNIYDSSAYNEEHLNKIFTELAKDNDIDEMDLLLDNYSFRKYFSPTQLYAYMSSIPKEDRLKNAYISIISSAKSILRHHKKQENADTAMIDKFEKYLEDEQDKYYQNLKNEHQESTNLIAGNQTNLLT